VPEQNAQILADNHVFRYPTPPRVAKSPGSCLLAAPNRAYIS